MSLDEKHKVMHEQLDVGLTELERQLEYVEQRLVTQEHRVAVIELCLKSLNVFNYVIHWMTTDMHGGCDPDIFDEMCTDITKVQMRVGELNKRLEKLIDERS